MTRAAAVPVHDLTADAFSAYGWMLGKPMPWATAFRCSATTPPTSGRNMCSTRALVAMRKCCG